MDCLSDVFFALSPPPITGFGDSAPVNERHFLTERWGDSSGIGT